MSDAVTSCSSRTYSGAMVDNRSDVVELSDDLYQIIQTHIVK